jgi:hypothetical protein
MLFKAVLFIVSFFHILPAVWGSEPFSGRITDRDGPGKSLLLDLEPALNLLGESPSVLCSYPGAPDALYSLRGESIGQDDVVFQYNDGFSLFFFRNRVWQVRAVPSYPLPGTLQFFLPRERVKALYGEPFSEDKDSFMYLLPDRGFPVRLRLFFGDDGMDDIYLYRADF